MAAEARPEAVGFCVDRTDTHQREINTSPAATVSSEAEFAPIEASMKGKLPEFAGFQELYIGETIIEIGLARSKTTRRLLGTWRCRLCGHSEPTAAEFDDRHGALSNARILARLHFQHEHGNVSRAA